MPNRHVPQRSCIVCGAKISKRDLFRIVLTPERECVVDETGKRPGRGAYLCHRLACWRGALRGRRLAVALRGDITPGDREKLAAFAERLPVAETAGAAG